MSFCGPGHLPDAHFLCAVGGAGGAEVHEIDAGDQEDKHGDDGKDVYILDIAVGFELAGLIGIKVHIGEGEDAAPEMIIPFFEVGTRNTEHCLEGRVNMKFDDRVNILLDLGPRGAGPGKDISIVSITYPIVVGGIVKVVSFADGANEAEMKMGLFRHVPDDAGDLEDCIVSTDLQRTADDIGAVEISAGGTFIDHD